MTLFVQAMKFPDHAYLKAAWRGYLPPCLSIGDQCKLRPGCLLPTHFHFHCLDLYCHLPCTILNLEAFHHIESKEKNAKVVQAMEK